MSRDPHNGSVEKHRVWCWRKTECKHIMRWAITRSVRVQPSYDADYCSSQFRSRRIYPHSREVTRRCPPRPPSGCRNEERNTHSLVNQPVVIGRNGGIPWLKSCALLNHSRLSGWAHDPTRYVTSLWWCKYSTKAIFSSSWKIWPTLKFLALGKFSNFLPVSSFRNCQNFPTQEVSTLSNCVRPCYHDSVRQLQPSGMQATYSSHSLNWYVS